jgi:AIPR protein
MFTKDFYDILDKELEKVVAENPDFELIRRHKKMDEKKAAALLIWFLKFYSPSKGMIYQRYITEGRGDNSCDIIFDVADSLGKTTFYVVQSKWKSKNNIESEINATDVKASLNDFETLLRNGKTTSTNKDFKRKYEELINHYEKNGTVKFIFLGLSLFNSDVQPNIKSFEKQFDGQVKIDVLDILKLKRDYIEKTYKQILTNNPLENLYNLEEERIKLAIERYEGTPGDYMKINTRTRAYVFFFKPKTIFELFEKYKHSLFFKNIRNPLPISEINEKIVATLNNEPASFWFYNNGITAISAIMPEVIGTGAKEIEVTGLQIINGAQTVHSIWSAYKDASSVKQEIMNRETLISMRVFESNDKDFNLKVTRYTNSQNEILSGDFYANDDIQIRLQNEFFNTRYWYQKRRGEFKDVAPHVMRVSNEFCAAAYLAYHLQNPIDAIEEKENFFISHKEDLNGLYEVIFNERTRFEDMFIAYSLFNKFMLLNKKDWKGVDVFETPLFHYLALSKIVIQKYITLKYGVTADTDKLIYDAFYKNEVRKINDFAAIFHFIKYKTNEFIANDANNDIEKTEETIDDFFTSIKKYEKVRDYFNDLDFTLEEVDTFLKK